MDWRSESLTWSLYRYGSLISMSMAIHLGYQLIVELEDFSIIKYTC